jgi:cold shock CspA family protein
MVAADRPTVAADRPMVAADRPTGAADRPTGDSGPGAGRRPAGDPTLVSLGLFAGTVSDFDEAAGLGGISSPAHPGTAVPFHCTAIADGSRTIEIGADVLFGLAPRHLGRFEAAEVTGRDALRSPE